MADYDSMAWFYNKYWTAYAPELFSQTLRDFLFPRLATDAAVLDLCCGTGQICKVLTDKGYSVTGLDISEGMLDIARGNAPKAEFVQADARYFALEKQFDAVTSFFDSINHLRNLDDLTSCFRSVKKALKPGGIFFFDVNDEDVFTESWENGFSMIEEDNICILKPVYDVESGLDAYNRTMMTKLDSVKWERTDNTVYEQDFDPEEIMRALSMAEFHNIKVLDGDIHLGISQFQGRVFFLAQ